MSCRAGLRTAYKQALYKPPRTLYKLDGAVHTSCAGKRWGTRFDKQAYIEIAPTIGFSQLETGQASNTWPRPTEKLMGISLQN